MQNQKTKIYKDFYEFTRDAEIRSQETTWHVIAKNDDVEIIRKGFFDLDKAEINIKNGEDKTPLTIAIQRQNLEMVKELIKCGAKDSLENMLKNLEFLIKNDNPEMFKELINHGAKDSLDNMLKYLGSAIAKNDPKMVKELITHGVEIPQENMFTFVNDAIGENNLEMVKELIKSGDKIPKENMLKLIMATNGIKKNNPISSYLVSVFNKNYNSEAEYQGVNSSNSSGGVGQSIPSCEPSPVKRTKLSDSKGNSL